MIRELLLGKKTQTRRTVKVQPPITSRGDAAWRDNKADLWRNAKQYARDCCPYGKVGDHLWVRETHWVNEDDGGVAYRADGEMPDHVRQAGTKWKSGIHMFRKHSRITLEVTDIRVERLQSITAADALAEGISKTDYWKPKEVDGKPFEEKWWDDFEFWTRYPKIAYKNLWESINGKGSWAADPFVWVVEFKRLEAN
jgi:hypothetical protein